MHGSGSSSGGSHGQQRLGVEHGDGRGHSARRGVAVLGHQLAAVEDDERVVGTLDRQPVRRQHLQTWAEAMRPAAEHHVQVAVAVGGDAARPVLAARQPRRGGDRPKRLRVEPLDPSLDRAGQRVAEGNVMPQRVELARLAADQQVGRECIADRGEDEALPRLDPQAGLPFGRAPAPRPAVLAGPRPRPVAADLSRRADRRPPASPRRSRGRGPPEGNGRRRRSAPARRPWGSAR